MINLGLEICGSCLKRFKCITGKWEISKVSKKLDVKNNKITTSYPVDLNDISQCSCIEKSYNERKADRDIPLFTFITVDYSEEFVKQFNHRWEEFNGKSGNGKNDSDDNKI